MKSDTSFLVPNNYVCFFTGLVSGMLFYGFLYIVAAQYPHQDVLQRMVGPVDHNVLAASIYVFLYILFFWGLMIILHKGMLARYEASALNVLGNNLDSARIIAKRSEIDALRDMINGPTCTRVRNTALVQILLFLLDHCLVMKSSGRVLELFSKRLDTLQRHIESSYNLLRYIAWAIPSLGFIGTVMGIGAALSSVETAMEDMNLVTRPLGMAFDTTLIALVSSMVLMFFLYNTQRREERLLNSIDLFCQEKFIINLQSELT